MTKRAPSFLRLLGFVLLISSAYTSLPASNLDTSFGTDGKVTTPVGQHGDFALAIALQADGKFVLAGFSHLDSTSNGPSDFAAARYTPDGFLDSSFGGTGKVITPFGFTAHSNFGASVALQPDGKILVGGSAKIGPDYDFALVRYTPDGQLDPKFNGTGKVFTQVSETGGTDLGHALALQQDGKILLVGQTPAGFAIVRYNPNGTLDGNFGSGGKVTALFSAQEGSDDAAYGVAVQPDGKIVVAGSAAALSDTADFALLRLEANGNLDLSFNGTGKVVTDFGGQENCRGVAVQNDGNIVAVGWSNQSDSDFAIARYKSNGMLDAAFNGSGKVLTDIADYDKVPVQTGNLDQANAVVLQEDGKIVVVGSSDRGDHVDFAVARYDTDGALDPSLNGTGIETTRFTSVFGFDSAIATGACVTSEGKIVVAGKVARSTLDFGVARYLGVEPTPTPDPTATPIPEPEKPPLARVSSLPGSVVNISTRLAVGGDDNVLIGGFIVDGIAPKRLIIRAVGPSLAASHVAGVLLNPTLDLFDHSGALIGHNDDWKTDQEEEITSSLLAPGDERESAIITTLAPGPYTAIVRGVDATQGVGLVEVYDLDASGGSRIANVSTRGNVGSGDDVMIGGFVVQSHRRKVLIRAIGPSLAEFHVSNPLADPNLQIYSDSQLIASNDNWNDANQQTTLSQFGLTPGSDKESAIVLDLEPGPYTAVVSGADSGTGVALVEAYDITVNPTAISNLTILDPTSPITDVVMENTGGAGMAIEGLKNADGSVTRVDKVILFDASTGTSSFVSFNEQGLVSRIESTIGITLSLTDYDLFALTATLVYIDPSRDITVGPVTVSIPPESASLREFILSGQFSPTARKTAGHYADSAGTSKSAWETGIGKLIAGTLAVASGVIEGVEPEAGLALRAWGGTEVVFGLAELHDAASGENPPDLIHQVSPTIDALGCVIGIATAESVVTIASTLISCTKTYNHLVGDSQTQSGLPNPGTLRFTSSEVVAPEGQHDAGISVERLGGTQGTVSATVVTAGGTATSGTDYVYIPQTVTFNDGEGGSKDVVVALVDDDVEEAPGDYVDFSFDNVSNGAAIGDPNICRLKILDDDRGYGRIEGSELVIEYTWPSGQKDLDTGTTFLGGTVGFEWDSTAPYMSWTGDDTSASGTEIVVIDIEKAAQDGVLPESFTIDVRAGWYSPAGGAGPATLTVYSRPKNGSHDAGQVTSRQISPGTQSGAATKSVGQVVFQVSPVAPFYKWSWH